MVKDLDTLMEEVKELPHFENPIGWMQYGRIPYKIRYNLEQPAGTLVNRKTPALYKVTPDQNLDGSSSESLSIWVWRGVPRDFRNILLYHELKEAEFRFADGLPKDESHKKAIPFHMAYAKKFLPESRFTEFQKWQSRYKAYGAESFFGK